MMGYELPPYRPPNEAHSLLIRATRGCPWNRCAFCNMYKEMKFELRSVEEVKEDIQAMKIVAQRIQDWAGAKGYSYRIGEVAAYSGIPWLHNDGVKTAFIGDSNSLVIKTEDLVEIIEFLRCTFPDLERVTSYARARTLVRKKPEELARLKKAGLSRVHVGLETGDDQLLQYVDKGATAAEMIEGGRKAKEAGLSLSEYVILGLGGKKAWQQHAVGTAKVLNEIDPDFIRVRTLLLHPGTPLYQKWAEECQICSPEEVLQETRMMLENLQVTSWFTSDHVSNYLPLEGKLPEEKERLLKEIDAVLQMPGEHRARLFPPEYLRRL